MIYVDQDDEDFIAMTENMSEEQINSIRRAIGHIEANMLEHPRLADDKKENLLRWFEGQIIDDTLSALLTPVVILSLTPEEQIELIRRVAADIGTLYDAMALHLSGEET